MEPDWDEVERRLQMRHWWTSCGDSGRGRVRNVMMALERMGAGR